MSDNLQDWFAKQDIPTADLGDHQNIEPPAYVDEDDRDEETGIALEGIEGMVLSAQNVNSVFQEIAARAVGANTGGYFMPSKMLTIMLTVPQAREVLREHQKAIDGIDLSRIVQAHEGADVTGLTVSCEQYTIQIGAQKVEEKFLLLTKYIGKARVTIAITYSELYLKTPGTEFSYVPINQMLGNA